MISVEPDHKKMNENDEFSLPLVKELVILLLPSKEEEPSESAEGEAGFVWDIPSLLYSLMCISGVVFEAGVEPL